MFELSAARTTGASSVRMRETTAKRGRELHRAVAQHEIVVERIDARRRIRLDVDRKVDLQLAERRGGEIGRRVAREDGGDRDVVGELLRAGRSRGAGGAVGGAPEDGGE